jgi:hypothetical protein
MSEVNVGGTNYSASDLIQLIQESNDAEHSASIAALQATIADRDSAVVSLTAQVASLEAVAVGSTDDGNLLQAILTRLAAVEASLPLTRAGFGVTTTIKDGNTCYRVQVLDQNGRTQIITFEIPLNTSSSSY